MADGVKVMQCMQFVSKEYLLPLCYELHAKETTPTYPYAEQSKHTCLTLSLKSQ